MCAFGFSHLIFQQTTTTATAENLGFLSLVALSGFVRGRKINHVLVEINICIILDGEINFYQKNKKSPDKLNFNFLFRFCFHLQIPLRHRHGRTIIIADQLGGRSRHKDDSIRSQHDSI